MTAALTTKKIVIGFVALLLIAFGSLWFFTERGITAFEGSYRQYAAVSEAHDFAAAVPSRNDNPVRARLFKLLSLVLENNLSDSERLAYAREGITLVEESEEQIDEIGTRAVPLGSALRGLESAAKSVGGRRADLAEDIAALAEERAELIGDIRGLSYSANGAIETIFRRILKDEGALTAEHVNELNASLPAAEESFDKRAAIYDQVLAIQNDIDDLYKEFLAAE